MICIDMSSKIDFKIKFSVLGFGGQPAAVPMQQMDSGGGGGGGFNASPYAPPGYVFNH